MKARPSIPRTVAALSLLAALITGCETTDGGGSSTAVYYGAGFGDPWYYGGYYDDPDIVVTPPPRPEHPIARPPITAPGPRPMPLPSLPARPMPRAR